MALFTSISRANVIYLLPTDKHLAAPSKWMEGSFIEIGSCTYAALEAQADKETEAETKKIWDKLDPLDYASWSIGCLNLSAITAVVAPRLLAAYAGHGACIAAFHKSGADWRRYNRLFRTRNNISDEMLMSYERERKNLTA